MWALGCVMAEVLTGEPLFWGAEMVDNMNTKVLELGRMDAKVLELGRMDVPELQACLRELSEAGHEVLCGLLSVKAEKRLTATGALNHRRFDEEDAPLPSALCSPPDWRGFINFF
ncbi:unnamed protein product [Urochloa humidicola]